uniref:C-type lectin domain-containing protein n=1 Tax=Poecilia latipinna TaxID=48699 RepID=A0A3B3TK90_9TELE
MRRQARSSPQAIVWGPLVYRIIWLSKRGWDTSCRNQHNFLCSDGENVHLFISYFYLFCTNKVNINMFDYSTETNTKHKYQLIEEKKSWQEAQSYCREKHTDLISGMKQLQDEEVKKLMNSTSDSSYIGLFRDTWRWSDGSSFSFRHWDKDFNNPETNSGQCAMTMFDDEGRWTNVNCTERKPFICYDGEFLVQI